MRKTYILFLSIVFQVPNYGQAEEASPDTCSQELIQKVLNYHFAVNSGMRTEGFFDIKGIEALMYDNGIPPREISSRMQRYILRLNEREKKISGLQAFNAICGAAASKLAIKVSNFEGGGALFLYTLIDGKITNISQESERHYKDLIFKPIPESRGQRP